MSLTSVIMPACNGGRYVAETVESAIKGLHGSDLWEIIVVDDCSEDGCCDQLETEYRITVLRTPKRLGCSKTRKFAGAQARGDVIISTDPHCFYPEGALTHLANVARAKRAIVIPKVHWEGKSVCVGGRLEIQRRGLRFTRPYRQPRYPTLLGSIYAWPRSVYEWLDGWPALPGRWGRWDQFVSVLAYRFGIPIVVDTKYKCTHRKYREHDVYPFELPQSEIIRNSHFVHSLCFQESYEKVWKPLLDIHHGSKPEYTRDLGRKMHRHWRKLIDYRSVMNEEQFVRRILGFQSLRDVPVIAERIFKTRGVA